MSAEILVPLSLAVLGLALSALYSGLETGLYTVNRIRLAWRAAHHDHRALRLRRQLGSSQRTLTVLLIGTNASNYLGTWGVAEVLHTQIESEWTAIAVNAVIVTPLLFVFAEVLPKDLFRTHTDRWTYWLAPFIELSRWVFTVLPLLPFVQLVTRVFTHLAGARPAAARTARQRISLIIREGVGAGMLRPAQATLTDRALLMRDQQIDSVFVPWRNVTRVSAGATRAAREVLFHSRNYTRLPVVDARGRVVGILSWAEAVLQRDEPTDRLMTPPFMLPASTRVLDAMTKMRRERCSMAIVADTSGKPVGIVTLKDLVEPLTGALPAW